jgi:hypothetical protein
LIPGCWPGEAFGAAGAVTPGVNGFPPVGLPPYSVGDGGAALDGGVVVVVVVVVVIVVEGACSPSLPHPAVSAPIAIRAPPPATTIKRRVNEFELMKIRIGYAAAVHELSHYVPTQLAATSQRFSRQVARWPSPGDGENSLGEFGTTDHQVG